MVVSDETSLLAVDLFLFSSHPSTSSPPIGMTSIAPSFRTSSTVALGRDPIGQPFGNELQPSWAEKPSSLYVSTLKSSSTGSSIWACQ
jgi:hypothetical protein